MRDELQPALRWDGLGAFADLVRQRGLRNVAGRVLRGVRNRVFAVQREIVIAKDIAATASFAGTDNLTLHAVGLPDDALLHRLADQMGRDDTMERKLASYAKNEFRCFVALRDGLPIGHVWWVNASDVLDRPHPHLSRFQIRLEEREVYLFDFVLLPAHRGGGNATEFFGKVERELRRSGYARMFGFVAPNNKQARWFYALQGWREVETVVSYLVLTRLLFSAVGVSVKNGRRSPTHSFDFRILIPRPQRRRNESTVLEAAPTADRRAC